MKKLKDFKFFFQEAKTAFFDLENAIMCQTCFTEKL